MKESPLIAIVGPTASGKTSLAIRVAKFCDGEIISADSRAVYRGLDIGTAKPTPEEQLAIPHWGIDLVNPGERFTVADFKSYADEKIAEIRSRNKVSIIVGGTGLYVDAVLYDYKFTSYSSRVDLRKKYEQKSLTELYNYCNKHNITLPENRKNKRYVVNAIMRNNEAPLKNSILHKNDIVVGITTDKEVLRNRIEQRAKTIVNKSTIAEAQNAAKKWGWNNEAMTGNIYPLVRQYLEGSITIDEMQDKFCTLDWRLAKRQLTWLKRNPEIVWRELDEAYSYIVRRLEESV